MPQLMNLSRFVKSQSFKITALLRDNLCTIQLIYLKCTVFSGF